MKSGGWGEHFDVSPRINVSQTAVLSAGRISSPAAAQKRLFCAPPQEVLMAAFDRIISGVEGMDQANGDWQRRRAQEHSADRALKDK